MLRCCCCCCCPVSGVDDESPRAPLLQQAAHGPDTPRRRNRSGRRDQRRASQRHPPRAQLPTSTVAHGADAWRQHVGSAVVDSVEQFQTPPLHGMPLPTDFVSGGDQLADQDGDADHCPTCLEEFSDENPAFWLRPCDHAFHLSCVLSWWEIGKEECPLCGAKVDMHGVVDGADTHTREDSSSDCDSDGSGGGYATPQEWRGSHTSGASSTATAGGRATSVSHRRTSWHDARSAASEAEDEATPPSLGHDGICKRL
jgi:hypothetical protein